MFPPFWNSLEHCPAMVTPSGLWDDWTRRGGEMDTCRLGGSFLSQQDWEPTRGGSTARTLIRVCLFTVSPNTFWREIKPDYSTRTGHWKTIMNESQLEKSPLSPLGVCTHRETPNCTGEYLCISKCNTTVLDFSILFVWSGVSIPIFKLCKKTLWAGFFFFLIMTFFHVLLFHFWFCFGFGQFTTLWAWPLFGLHFFDSEASSSFYHVWSIYCTLLKSFKLNIKLYI